MTPFYWLQGFGQTLRIPDTLNPGPDDLVMTTTCRFSGRPSFSCFSPSISNALYIPFICHIQYAVVCDSIFTVSLFYFVLFILFYILNLYFILFYFVSLFYFVYLKNLGGILTQMNCS